MGERMTTIEKVNACLGGGMIYALSISYVGATQAQQWVAFAVGAFTVAMFVFG